MLVSMVGFVGTASAQGSDSTNVPDTIGEVLRLFSTVATWMVRFFWVAAVISGVYAAYLYLTGGSKPDNISKASRQLIYTVIAVLVAILAFVLPNILESFVTQS